jgi:hypothetical protein
MNFIYIYIFFFWAPKQTSMKKVVNYNVLHLVKLYNFNIILPSSKFI